MQLLDAGWLVAKQDVPQDFRKEGVIAEPVAPLVYARDEQALAIQLLQDDGTVGGRQHRVAERPAQAGQYRRAKEKTTRWLGQMVEDFLYEVVDDKMVAAAEPRDRCVDRGRLTERDRRHLQARCPALGARRNRRDLRRCEVMPEDGAHQPSRFVLREAEVGCPHLEHITLETTPRQRQRRINARAQDDMEARRRVVEQRDQPGMNLGRLDEVVVVKDKDHVVL